MQLSGEGHYLDMKAHTVGKSCGFTLIELLVVIGIVVSLIAIIAAGVRHTRGLALRHSTQVRLKICEDLLAEYKAVNGYKYILGSPDSVTTGNPIQLPPAWITGKFNAPMFVYPRNNGASEVTAQIFNPVSTLTLVNFQGSVFKYLTSISSSDPIFHGNMNVGSDPNAPRWVSDCVRWTQGVMFLLLKDPKNRALLGNLPPESFLEGMPAPVNGKSGAAIGVRPQGFTMDAAVVLDAWRNPIIFVPPGGMHVLMDGDGQGVREWVVRTSGTYDVAKPIPPVGRNDRPFFASTGADGYFTDIALSSDPNGYLVGTDKPTDNFAADNVYSFRD